MLPRDFGNLTQTILTESRPWERKSKNKSSSRGETEKSMSNVNSNRKFTRDEKVRSTETKNNWLLICTNTKRGKIYAHKSKATSWSPQYPKLVKIQTGWLKVSCPRSLNDWAPSDNIHLLLRKRTK